MITLIYMLSYNGLAAKRRGDQFSKATNRKLVRLSRFVRQPDAII